MIWRGKNNDDIYIAPRSAAGQVKASFHPPRYCYFGFPREYAEKRVREGRFVPPGRAWTSWERPATPEDQLLRVAEIWLPPGPLHDPGGELKKEISCIDPPPDGKAVVISINFSRIPEGKAVIPADVRELGYSRLSTGEYVIVFRHLVDFDYQSFKAQFVQQAQAIAPERGEFLTNPEKIISSTTLRMFSVNDPKLDGCLKIFDIPVTISRDVIDQRGAYIARI
jgi:hypothetical protein